MLLSPPGVLAKAKEPELRLNITPVSTTQLVKNNITLKQEAKERNGDLKHQTLRSKVGASSVERSKSSADKRDDLTDKTQASQKNLKISTVKQTPAKSTSGNLEKSADAAKKLTDQKTKENDLKEVDKRVITGSAETTKSKRDGKHESLVLRKQQDDPTYHESESNSLKHSKSKEKLSKIQEERRVPDLKNVKEKQEVEKSLTVPERDVPKNDSDKKTVHLDGESESKNQKGKEDVLEINPLKTSKVSSNTNSNECKTNSLERGETKKDTNKQKTVHLNGESGSENKEDEMGSLKFSPHQTSKVSPNTNVNEHKTNSPERGVANKNNDKQKIVYFDGVDRPENKKPEFERKMTFHPQEKLMRMRFLGVSFALKLCKN